MAEPLVLATFNTDLSRDGPGLMLRDLRRGDPQAEAAAAVIASVAPDVILLTGIDWDLGGATLAAFADRVAAAGVAYPHRLTLRPNAGWMTDADLDGDGRLRGPGDAQGWGRFPGEGGMAILSRLPIEAESARNWSAMPWRDLPGADLPPGVPAPVAGEQRLSTTGHWAVPLRLSDGRRLTLLAFHATPPVFDGAEDRNGRRNHDEAAFWLALLDGRLPDPAPAEPFVLMGTPNLDPVDGDGRPGALRALLSDPRLTDPQPRSDGGAQAVTAQRGANLTQAGDPAMDTADWPDGPDDPGNLRVDMVLPSAGLRVTGAGVVWPPDGAPLAAEARAASRHRLVWVAVDPG